MNAIRAIQSFFGPGAEPVFLGLTGLGTGAVLWAFLFLYSWLADPASAAGWRWSSRRRRSPIMP